MCFYIKTYVKFFNFIRNIINCRHLYFRDFVELEIKFQASKKIVRMQLLERKVVRKDTNEKLVDREIFKMQEIVSQKVDRL